MKNICLALSGICLWQAALVTPVMAANLLKNPGFEADVAGDERTIPEWSNFNNNTYNQTGAEARSGTSYFKIYQAYTGCINYTGIYQDCPASAGTTYSAEGWGKVPSGDVILGQNSAWIEITFRDGDAKMLSLYKSGLITTNGLANGSIPSDTWFHLSVTNQYNPKTYSLMKPVKTLVAPQGTRSVRYQITFQGDAAGSNGSVYFDDLNLIQSVGSTAEPTVPKAATAPAAH